MRRTRFVGAGFLLAVLAFGPAAASPATFTDPDDSPGKLDLRTISHRDDAQTITYEIDTYDDWESSFTDFTWHLRTSCCPPLRTFDVRAKYNPGSSQIEAKVVTAEGQDVATATAERRGTRGLAVSFGRASIRPTGCYMYTVSSAYDADGTMPPSSPAVRDNTNGFNHHLDDHNGECPERQTTPTPNATRRVTAQPRPRAPVTAAPPTPSASPILSPSASPTSSPTPSATAGFAAPRERSTGRTNPVPLALAAGALSVATAGAIAYQLRRR